MMRLFYMLLFSAVVMTSCDDERVYEKNEDFHDRFWKQSDKPEFEFEVGDVNAAYNVYLNIRNSVDYPYSRIFINYSLQDSTGKALDKQLLNAMLFDPKTGSPEGTSGLGDIYDHQIPVKKNHRFGYRGKYKISFEQFMRMDTLEGVLAIGVRIEKLQLDARAENRK
jgi:gliding motility-associated lipoprotein GldH